MRLARMLLNGGELDGVKILKPSTVKLMSTDQLDARVTERNFLPSKGSVGFGMDFAVRVSPPQKPQENRGAVDGVLLGRRGLDVVLGRSRQSTRRRLLHPEDAVRRHAHRDIRKAIYSAITSDLRAANWFVHHGGPKWAWDQADLSGADGIDVPISRHACSTVSGSRRQG
jgi:hypothetical protein